jgi:Cdc6-like AAA superfamily ATPase
MQLGPTDNGTPAPPRPPPHPPATTTAQATPDNPRWILFVTGPTACGKTTVAKYLAEQLPAKYLEGDDVSCPPSPSY